MSARINASFRSSRREGLRFRRAHGLRSVPLTLSVFLLLGGAVGTPVRARAQGQESPPPSSKEIDQLYDMLDDINKLNVLNPLKLTPDQLDKLIAVADATATDYAQKVAALKAQSIHDLAKEIRATKQRAVAGGEITQSFLTQIISRSDSLAKKRDDLDINTWVAMIAKVRQILTPDQYNTAIKEIRTQADKEPDINSHGKPEQWFNMFVLQVFLKYPRIVPLLKEMRAAAGNVPQSAANGEAAGQASGAGTNGASTK